MKVVKSEASKAMRRIVDSLKEIDLVIASWEAERAKCITIIERYGKDANKNAYRTKAVPAAIAGDSIEDTIKSLVERKKRLLRALQKVLGLYTGDAQLAEAVVTLILAGGDPNKARIKNQDTKEEAVAFWKDLCFTSRQLAKQRMMKRILEEKK